MSYNRYDESKNSTVSWIPSFFREFLGLNSEYKRPEYGNYGSSKREIADSTTSWIPGFFRRWVGIEYTEPQRYGPSPRVEERRAAPRPQPAPRPAAPPRDYSQSYGTAPAPTSSARSSYGSSSSSYGSARSSYGGGKDAYVAPRPEGAQRMDFRSGSDSYSSEGGGGAMTPGGGEQPPRFEGYVKPITYGVRGYLRGALPPQGLEAFLRQLRTTVQDVTNMYQRAFELQTHEIGEAIDTWRRQRPSGGDGTHMTKVTVETGDAAARPAATSSAAPPPAPSTPATTSTSVDVETGTAESADAEEKQDEK